MGDKGDICPKCGQRYNYVEKRTVGNNTYYYAVHVIGRGKDRKKRKCYLGPEKYIYNKKKHAEISKEQLAQILPLFISQLEKAKEDPEILNELGLDLATLGKLAGKLLRLVNTLKRKSR
jgi:hypothetical protein